MQRDREIARTLLEAIFENDDIGERARLWMLTKLEQYIWHQYQYRKRKMQYIEYVSQTAKTKAILQKKDWLLQDLEKTRQSILERAKKGKVVVRAGTKDNPSRQEAALYMSALQFSSLFEETARGEQVWNTQMPKIELQKTLF